MMRRWLLFLLLTICVSAPQAVEFRDPYAHFFNDTFGDFSEELESAREGNKKGVMLFFEMDECPFCHYMKKKVLSRPDVQSYFRKNFLLFHVDIEGDVEINDFTGNTITQKDFATKINRVRATPVIAFYDLEGKQIHRYTGRTNGADEFLLLGQFVVDGHYTKSRFSRYKRQQRSK